MQRDHEGQNAGEFSFSGVILFIGSGGPLLASARTDRGFLSAKVDSTEERQTFLTLIL